jgi:outer membrane protein
VGLLAGLALAGWSRAGQAEGAKIGYFDVKQILAEADEAAEIKKKLQVDFDKKQKSLDALKDEIEAKQKDLEAKQSVLSPEALRQAQGELQAKVQDAQKTYMTLQQELAGKEQQAIGDLLAKLQPIVQQMAQDEGYTYIFEKNEAGLFYAPAEHDLTAQLLRKVNAAYRARGGSAGAKTGAGATKGSKPK